MGYTVEMMKTKRIVDHYILSVWFAFRLLNSSKQLLPDAKLRAYLLLQQPRSFSDKPRNKRTFHFQVISP